MAEGTNDPSFDLILHHYEGSLFSEKIRAILGYKALPWCSVVISPVMPRPLLMPLTGGYRRTPVLQVGADVFCDTHVITEYLDERRHERPLHPEALGWAVRSLTQRADTHLFRVVVALCFQPKAIEVMMRGLGEDMLQTFAADRAELSRGSSGVTTLPPEVAQAELADELVRLETQLASTHWVCGGMPTIADFAVYHCLWLLERNPVVAPLLMPYAAVRDWMQRIAGFGHADHVSITAEAALEVARAASPMELLVHSGHLPEGVRVGAPVTVTPVDYGLVPVAGVLDYCTAHACAVLREDPQAGAVRVHFPRTGFRIDPA
ncbi:MAG: glutathione S-transferase family protein [Pseudomonadales bacterium]|jgi:glutathione S-transferase|nr:glutathione S-transferase family protein [Pseudomonadales bacterium]